MGNCLERSVTDEADDQVIDRVPSDLNTVNTSRNRSHSNQSRHNRYNRSNRRSHHHQNHYTRLSGNISNSSSLISLNNSSNTIISNQNINIRNDNYSNSFIGVNSFQSTNSSSIFSPSSVTSNFQIGSVPVAVGSLGCSSSFFQNSLGQTQQQIFYLSPNVQRSVDQLTEEEQIKLLKRMTLIQQLPSGSYDENKKNKECVICMIDFEVKDTIKYLPCLHTFHQSCIDSWLIRSLICPSCCEPVDAGLLSAFENE